MGAYELPRCGLLARFAVPGMSFHLKLAYNPTRKWVVTPHNIQSTPVMQVLENASV